MQPYSSGSVPWISIVNGTQEKICVDPGIFQHLISFNDAYNMAILSFLLGMAVIIIYDYIDQKYKDGGH